MCLHLSWQFIFVFVVSPTVRVTAFLCLPVTVDDAEDDDYRHAGECGQGQDKPAILELAPDDVAQEEGGPSDLRLVHAREVVVVRPWLQRGPLDQTRTTVH